ncbi:MAG: DUF2179 domain-containing protein [Bacteroidetes bacterium]|nr:DUF2179 domain-containing protein [Bacteroidota bacterium]
MNGFDYYNWLILPLIIFFSRICDVTLGTLRHVLMARGNTRLVPVLGFFEVLIWIVVVSQVMKQLNNVACYIAWAGGFATGSYVGLLIEEKLAFGMQLIRMITNRDCTALLNAMQKANHGTTLLNAQGAKGPVQIILIVVKRKNLEEVTALIEKHEPDIFYSIEDIRGVSKGVFTKTNAEMSVLRKMFPTRKAK